MTERPINPRTWNTWSLVTDGRDVMTADDYDPSDATRRVLGECVRCESLVLAEHVTGTNYGTSSPLMCDACAALRADAEDDAERARARIRAQATKRRGFGRPDGPGALASEAPEHNGGDRFGGFDIGDSGAREHHVKEWRREHGRASARPREHADPTADRALRNVERERDRRPRSNVTTTTTEDVAAMRTREDVEAALAEAFIAHQHEQALRLRNARHAYDLHKRAQARRNARRNRRR